MVSYYTHYTIPFSPADTIFLTVLVPQLKQGEGGESYALSAELAQQWCGKAKAVYYINLTCTVCSMP